VRPTSCGRFSATSASRPIRRHLCRPPRPSLPDLFPDAPAWRLAPGRRTCISRGGA